MEEFPFFQHERFSGDGGLFHNEAMELFSNESGPGFFDSKEDFQMLLNWSDVSDTIPNSFCEDVDLTLNVKTEIPLEDSPLLTNALTSQIHTEVDAVKRVAASRCGEKIVFPGDVEPLQVSNSTVQTNNVLKRITQARSVLINGEKEIFGKNIIGLHCLNEITTSSDNCQMSSTFINGKKYNIIIKPKSAGARSAQAVAAAAASAAAATAFASLPIKTEPVDELISELQNGDYDVLGHEDVQDPWALPPLPLPIESDDLTDNLTITSDHTVTSPPPLPPRVPPLRIKIPKPKQKTKKHKKKTAVKGNALSEVPVPSKCEVVKEEKSERTKGKVVPLYLPLQTGKSAGKPCAARASRGTFRNPPTSLASPSPELLSPASPTSTCSTDDMSPQSEESIPMDHDYCSYKRRQIVKVASSETKLMEKNPRKDSGLESGGVSDASEESPSPAHTSASAPLPALICQSAPILAKELTNKLLEERRRPKSHSHVTKMAAALFRAANAVTSNTGVMAGPKLYSLVNDEPQVLPADCDNSETSQQPSPNPSHDTEPVCVQDERPKKKLKLEEYLNRRNESSNLDSEDLKKEVGELPDVVTAACPMPDDQILEEGEVPCDIVEVAELVTTHSESAPVVTEAIASVEEKPNRESRQCETAKPNTIKVRAVSHRRRSCDDVARNEYKRKSSSYTVGAGTVSPVARHSRISSSSSTEDYTRMQRASRIRGSRCASRDKPSRYRSRSRSRSSSRSTCSSTSSGSSPRRRSFFNSPRYRRRTRTRSRSSHRSRSRGHGGRHRPTSVYSRQPKGGRSGSPVYSHRDKQRQIEERRVVYVGRIAEGTTNHQLRQRFSLFGPIVDISVHFREHGDNYGFVTFAYKDDAYQAVEHGNDNSNLPKFDLSFGGRRTFCKQRYADLDGMPTSYSGFNDSPVIRTRDDSFDLLLKQAKAQLHMRKDGT